MSNNYKKKYLAVIIGAIIAVPASAVDITEHSKGIKNEQKVKIAEAVKVYQDKHAEIVKAKAAYKQRIEKSKAEYQKKLNFYINGKKVEVIITPSGTVKVETETETEIEAETENSQESTVPGVKSDGTLESGNELTLEDLQELINSGALDNLTSDDPFLENDVFEEDGALDLVQEILAENDSNEDSLSIILNGESIDAESEINLEDLQFIVDSGQLDGASLDDPFFLNPVFEDPAAIGMVTPVLDADSTDVDEIEFPEVPEVPEVPLPGDTSEVIHNGEVIDENTNLTIEDIQELIISGELSDVTSGNPVLNNPIFNDPDVAQLVDPIVESNTNRELNEIEESAEETTSETETSTDGSETTSDSSESIGGSETTPDGSESASSSETTSGGTEPTGGSETTSGGTETTSGGTESTGGSETTSGGTETTSGGTETTSGGSESTNPEGNGLTGINSDGSSVSGDTSSGSETSSGTGEVVIPELPESIPGNHYYLTDEGDMTENSVYVLVTERFFEETTLDNPLLNDAIFESEAFNDIFSNISVGSDIPTDPITDEIFNDMLIANAFHNINSDNAIFDDAYFNSVNVLRQLYDAEVGRNFSTKLLNPTESFNKSNYTFDDVLNGLESGEIQAMSVDDPFLEDSIFENFAIQILASMYGMEDEN